MQHRKRRTKVRRFYIFAVAFSLEKLQKTSFSNPWFYPARGVIFEMHPAVFTVWCDSDTPASKKEEKSETVLLSSLTERRSGGFLFPFGD